MKTIENTRVLTESGPFTSYQFGIRSEDLSHIFGVLRNQMYSDKVLAVIREYSTNAYDAHVVAGIKDTPIRVSLPNTLFPEFKVRDYGRGLSEEDVKNVYAWYGCSTKRNDNDTVGQLGFGSKSAFAYGDNFVITSYHNGKKTVYNAVIDPSKKGKISKLHEEAMAPTDTTGVEITVPVKPTDFNQFVSKSKSFYIHWDVKPDMVGYDKETFFIGIKPVLESDGWKIFQDVNNMSYTRLLALMGNVTYPINFSILNEKCDDYLIQKNNDFLSDFLGRNYNSLLIRFNIGDLEISSSRESLQYSEHTLKNIYTRIQNVIEHIKTTIFEEIKNEKNVWDAKIKYNEFFEIYGSKFYGHQNNVGPLNNNGYPILNSYFNDIHRWCNVNGFIDDDKLNKFNNDSKNNVKITYDSVLTIYTYNDRRSIWKVNNPHWSNPSGGVFARKRRMFVINDIETNYLVTKCINYLNNKHGLKNDVVYMLRFVNDNIYNSFMKHYCIDNMTIHRLSEVVDEVKSENKKVRKPTSKLTRVKVDTLTTRPNLCQFNAECEIDLSTGGYYVPMFDGDIIHNNTSYRLNNIASALESFQVIKKIFNENTLPDYGSEVYGFNRRVMDSKAFKANESKWINLIEKFTEVISTYNAEDYYKHRGYWDALKNYNYFITPKICKKLYNLLDNKNTKLAQFLKATDKYDTNIVYDHLVPIYDCLSLEDSNQNILSNRKKLHEEYTSILDNYPLVLHLGFIQSWQFYPNKNDLMSQIQILADYINLVDKTNKTV